MTEDNGTRRAKHAAGDDPIEESVKDADTAVVTMTDDEPPISRAVIDTSAVADGPFGGQFTAPCCAGMKAKTRSQSLPKRSSHGSA